jgi:hypothetical protein
MIWLKRLSKKGVKTSPTVAPINQIIHSDKEKPFTGLFLLGLQIIQIQKTRIRVFYSLDHCPEMPKNENNP